MTKQSSASSSQFSRLYRSNLSVEAAGLRRQMCIFWLERLRWAVIQVQCVLHKQQRSPDDLMAFRTSTQKMEKLGTLLHRLKSCTIRFHRIRGNRTYWTLLWRWNSPKALKYLFSGNSQLIIELEDRVVSQSNGSVRKVENCISFASCFVGEIDY